MPHQILDRVQEYTTSTGTGGQGIASGNCIGYNATFSLLQFIQGTSGAILGVSFYDGGAQ